MPAIHLARLRLHAAQLAQHFEQPDELVKALHELLDYYANRTHHAGRSGEPPPLILAYHVPRPVLRQVEAELVPLVHSDPDKAMALCDTLWKEANLEFRLITARLLGEIPPNSQDSILRRVEAWATTCNEDRLVTALAEMGLQRLREESPLVLLNQVEAWLDNEETVYIQLALRSIAPLISNPDFENIPGVFRLITPLARKALAMVEPDLLDVMNVLARRTPRETFYFLRQILMTSDDPRTARCVRQALKVLPIDLQSELRRAH